jgi:hypothetical protein
MTICFTFKSNLADPHEEDEQGAEVTAPAGLRHSKLLATELGPSFVTDDPWNEGGYWEFIGKANGVTVRVLVQENWYEGGADEGNWLLILHPVSLFGFLYRRRLRDAVTAVGDTIDALLRRDQQFQGVCRYSPREYDDYTRRFASQERLRKNRRRT